MKTTAIIALLCATIFMTPYPYPCLGGDNAAYPPASKPSGDEICFPLPDGERILRDLEALPPCRDAVAAAEEAIKSSEIRSQALENRIVEQDGELKDARKLVDDTRKAGEEAAKVAAGPWYARALSVVKWVALGIIVGFVGGMGK
jgi:hypothetical protein